MGNSKERPDMVNISASPEKLNDLVVKIIRDDEFQKKFEADPKAVLSEAGIELPEDVIPDKIDVRAIISDMERIGSQVASPYVRVGVVILVAVAPAPTAVLSSLETDAFRSVTLKAKKAAKGRQ